MIKRILQWIVGFMLCICSAILMIKDAGRLFVFGLILCVIGVSLILAASWKIRD